MEHGELADHQSRRADRSGLWAGFAIGSSIGLAVLVIAVFVLFVLPIVVIVLIMAVSGSQELHSDEVPAGMILLLSSLLVR